MRWLILAVLVATLTGCHAFTIDVDGRVERRAAMPIDEQPELLPTPPRPMPGPEMPPDSSGLVHARFGPLAQQREVARVSWQKAELGPDKGKPGSPTMLDRLQPPETLIGAKVPDIKPPPPKATDAEKDAWIKEQFPPLPPTPKLPAARPGGASGAMTLAELQQIALRANPIIRQAHHDVQAARGAALQAGLYPNPAIGYAGSTVGQGNSDGIRSPGQQGGFVEQTIVTAGKLNIAREAAQRDVEISEQRLKAAEAEVQAHVRRGYFAVLAAQKNFETTKALAQLTDELYNVLLLQLKAGEVAAYEPMQIRVLALQARGVLVLAHNRYVSAWKQLTATLGMPGEPLTALSGRIDAPVPHFEHDAVLAYVLTNHTDVRAAQLGVTRAQFLLRLAEVQPYPDPVVQIGFQKDYTTPPFGGVANIGVGIPVPLWNRNQGNIQTARAMLDRAQQENQKVRIELTAKVAEAFERYENNRTLIKLYKEQVLPNQVQAFRASVARHVAEGAKTVSYNDLVNAQQTLASLIANYLTILNEQWNSAVDIAQLLQTRDLYQTQRTDDVAPVPDMFELLHERPWRHFRRR